MSEGRADGRVGPVAALVVCMASLFTLCGLCAAGAALLSTLDVAEEPAEQRTAAEVEARWHAYLDGAPPTTVRRTLTVSVVADEEYRRRSSWEADARALLADGSALLERELGLRLRVVDVRPCTSDDRARDLLDLSDSVRKTIELDADVVVFLTGQNNADDTYERGYAPYFGRFVTMRPTEPGGTWLYDRETIAHELGHVLGAWHSGDPDSVMRFDKLGDERFRFDARSRAVIAATLGTSGPPGLDSLDAQTLAHIDTLYRADRGFRDMHPVAYELYRRAHAAMRAGGDPEPIRADVARADAIMRQFRTRGNERARRKRAETRFWLESAASRAPGPATPTGR